MTIERINFNGKAFDTLRNVDDVTGHIVSYSGNVPNVVSAVYTVIYFKSEYGTPLAVTVPMDGRIEVTA
jgi:hypothetical protein